jgi:hypothetical protein
MRQIMVSIIVLPLLVGVALYGARNYAGEVATLYTTDAGDRTFTTQVWVVEHGHELWIRSLRPTNPWLDRVINQPDVQLERHHAVKTYRATPLAHRRSRINALMAEQYGWAEWLLAKFEDRDEAVPVYLDPFG